MAEVPRGVCMICAVQLWEWSPDHDQSPNPYKWREAHVLLSGPTWPCDEKGPQSMTIPDTSVTIRNARVFDHGRATLATGLSVSLQLENLPEQHQNHDPANGHRWYLAIHSACEAMARGAMRAPCSKIRTMGDLWMTIDRRCVKTADDDNLLPLYLPKVPENRPGEPIELGLGRYYIPRSAICSTEPVLNDPSHEWWNYDPLNIPHMTEALLSNLERHEASSTTCQQFTNRFNSLPREIKDVITSHLGRGSTSLKCTYLIPQSCWKEVLFRIPFLWDIEKDLVETKNQEALLRAFEWNWEKLVRQIMSEVSIVRIDDEIDPEVTTLWSYQKVGLTVQPSLTNRRRIWQILADMYPNDVGMVHFMGDEDVVVDKDY
ncbi:hypothetical protein FALBO_106 [Fusarium albosuccineum]|uniref:Uncharacterized protein n=1 Tax=Fusarium albosuccineum TaxID=1237068 RepID=A0A8H4LP88_9HYPO|nr:hypothetical protein FALBO_106 [Fusarium albosuccineum]